MGDIPVAAIICLGIGSYVFVVIGFIALCYYLKCRGKCAIGFHWCAKEEGGQSCQCCVSLSETCNCFKLPSINDCMKSCCPNKKKLSLLDAITCQCCPSGPMTICDTCYEFGNQTLIPR